MDADVPAPAAAYVSDDEMDIDQQQQQQRTDQQKEQLQQTEQQKEQQLQQTEQQKEQQQQQKPRRVKLTPDGGVVKQVIREPAPDAEAPEAGDEVSVHYTGRFLDGKVFDSSHKRSTPFKFFLGKAQVIKGWDLGVASMRRGEKAFLRCKPEYAYGAQGSGSIPANSTLVFEVELLDWVSKNDITVAQDGGILKKVLRAGRGKQSPYMKWEVAVHYTVFIGDREVFTTEKGAEPARFVIGSPHTLPQAIERAVQQMMPGERVRLTCKAKYAYGSAGSEAVGVPPNSDVVLEVELVEATQLTDLITDEPGVLVKRMTEQGEGYKRPTVYSTCKVKLMATVEGRSEPLLSFDGTEDVRLELGDLPEAADLLLISMNKGETATVQCNVGQFGYGAEGNAQRGLDPAAILTVTATLLDMETSKEWYTFTPEEKIANGLAQKDLGNMFFKQGQYRRAVRKYKEALQYHSSDHGFSDEEKKRSQEVKLPCHLNYAACALKLGDTKKAKEECTSALKIDNSSVKALYRRAQALHLERLYEDAKADLARVLELDAASTDARDLLAKVTDDIRKHAQKEKQVYSKLFA